jgi:hypothetical protein
MYRVAFCEVRFQDFSSSAQEGINKLIVCALSKNLLYIRTWIVYKHLSHNSKSDSDQLLFYLRGCGKSEDLEKQKIVDEKRNDLVMLARAWSGEELQGEKPYLVVRLE